MKILHLSDIHAGDSSSANDTALILHEQELINGKLEDKKMIIPYPHITNQILKNTINYLKHLTNINLVIYSGDFISKGHNDDFKNPILISIFKIFIDEKIPIITCVGNHETDEIKAKKGNFDKFDGYIRFIKENFQSFQMHLSEDFDNDQISFVDFPNDNILFVSFNSCVNIITSKEEYGHPASLDYEACKNFMEKSFEKNQSFRFRNIFAIMHHPLKNLENHVDSISFLKEYHINLVFAGDLHKYSSYNNGILGFTAGSLYGSRNIRYDPLNNLETPKQFNFYEITNTNLCDLSHLIIEIHEENQKWIKKIGDPFDYELNFFLKVWNPNEWCKYLKFNILFNLEKENIKFIVKCGSNGDFVGYKADNSQLQIYVIDNLTRSISHKVKIILSHITGLLKQDKIVNVRVVDKIGATKSQISDEWVWKDV